MISLSLVSIFLLASCLTRVTAYESGLTGIPLTVTPVDGTHLKLDYQKSVNTDYKQVKDVTIHIDVSTYNQKISHTVS